MRTGNLLIYSAKFDHRTAPSFSAERDWVIDSPPIPRARPGDGRHDQLGNFQTALLGRITPASTFEQAVHLELSAMQLKTLNARSAGLLVALTSASMAQELPRPP